MVQREILKICCYIKQIYNNINLDFKTNNFASLNVLLQFPPLNHLHATKLNAIQRIHFFKECEITRVNLKKITDKKMCTFISTSTNPSLKN